ncbi:MAG: hypothetical protein ACK41V_22875 [Acidovorax sp.]|uniref:hypothetical protein n=1 Tax=Acidovorax sp. TaxID=1872122 RepID=UPI003919D8E6
MNPSLIAAVEDTPVDGDLAEQAAPGHGVPSQDPNPAAQQILSPAEADRESQSALVGGGVMAGAAAGAAVGVAVGGPVGALVGGTAGAIAGALGGAAVGQVVEPEAPADPAHETTQPVYVEKPKAQV